MQDIKYTRAYLQNIVKEKELQELRTAVKRSVEEIRNDILASASQGNTHYVRLCKRPSDPADKRYKVIMAVVEDLKTIFPDVSIEYNEEKDVIRADWS
jgi:hypothetical protein